MVREHQSCNPVQVGTDKTLQETQCCARAAVLRSALGVLVEQDLLPRAFLTRT